MYSLTRLHQKFRVSQFRRFSAEYLQAIAINPSTNVNRLFSKKTMIKSKLPVPERKTYALKNYTKKITSIFCRNDLGPCFGELGEDIWIESDNFLKEGGILHKGKEIGRICSFDTADYELTNGERYFKIKELEAFWLGY